LAAKASELAPIETATGQIATHSAVLALVKQVGNEFVRMTATQTNAILSTRVPECLGSCVMMRLRISSANASALKTVVDIITEPTVTTTISSLSTVALPEDRKGVRRDDYQCAQSDNTSIRC